MPVNLDGARVLVMGIGKFGGGHDAVKYASRFAERVLAADLSPAEKIHNIDELAALPNVSIACGEHKEEDFRECDVLIVNPAVPPENRFIQIARDSGAVVTSSIALFFERCPAKIVAITGSNGKSTTTALTYHILSHACESGACEFRKAWLGGNIGNLPLMTALDEITAEDVVVLEISSFQAEQLDTFRLAPYVAAITNLTPNHLDRHGTFENYCNAKKTMFQNLTGGFAFLNAEDPVSSSWCNEMPAGVSVQKFSAEDVPQRVYQKYPLPGRANKSNLAAARSICRAFGVDDETIASSLAAFKALPHRLELVAQSNGIKWYNDSISTTPESTIAGINAFDGGILLIAGGYDKKIPFDDMCRLAAERVKAAVLIGTTAKTIGSLIEGCAGNRCKVVYAGTLQEAVDFAAGLAQSGDSILLSPACASYDMFDNFKQRGDMFSAMARSKCND
ncbi:MAG: UDP-N-acetylmuramoyl-L-alanine--D-glutamate ligase [Phycisphaerae bacterium]